MNPAEVTAIRADAERRLVELVAVRDALRPHVDDAEVLSEYVVIVSQIRAAECALTVEHEARR